MKPRIRTVFPLCTALLAGSAQAYSFQMDTFAVWKNFDAAGITTPSDLLNTPPIFYDSFADTFAPPWGPSGPTNYAMFGSVGPEDTINGEGILTLDSAGALPNDYLTPVQQAILITNVTPGSALGLKQASTSFAVGGIFNLINPGNSPGSYGVRFTDVGVSGGNDIVSLSVHGRADGMGVIRFSSFDNTTGIHTLISQQVLDSSHQQISLGLSYVDPAGASPKAVYATYFYLDNDMPTAFFGLAGSAELFHGEDFTRAALYAAASNPVPVPEPAEYALMLVGLGLVGWASQRKRR